MFDLDGLNLIRERIIIPTNNGTFSDENSYHIFLCADDSYALPLGVTLTSVVKNNTNKSITFHIFLLDFSQENQTKLSEIMGDNSTSIILYFIDIDNFLFFFKIPKNRIAMCFRLFVPYLLKDVAQKILYIDSDILCLGDIKKLEKNSFDNKVIMAVADLPKIQKSQSNKFNLSYGSYFNSGVIYVDIQKWTQKKISERLASILSNGIDNFKFPDQDILNIILAEDVKYLPTDFNTINIPYVNLPINDTVLFYHFAGEEKPWYKTWESELYNKYLKLSPWCDDQLRKNQKRNYLKEFVKSIRNKIRFFIYRF